MRGRTFCGVNYSSTHEANCACETCSCIRGREMREREDIFRRVYGAAWKECLAEAEAGRNTVLRDRYRIAR